MFQKYKKLSLFSGGVLLIWGGGLVTDDSKTEFKCSDEAPNDVKIFKGRSIKA